MKLLYILVLVSAWCVALAAAPRSAAAPPRLAAPRPLG